MRLLCVMPTYGRRAELLNNSIACFTQQVHEDKLLLLYDDLGTLANAKVDVADVHIISVKDRVKSLGQKYNDILYGNFVGDYDALVIWDDDDIYLPKYLSAHAKTLENNTWSKPSIILASLSLKVHTETNTAGRFHGSIAVRKQLALAVGGWSAEISPSFDQEFIRRLAAQAAAGDPLDFASPQYVYRWSSSGASHSSGTSNNADWYTGFTPDSRLAIRKLTARFDKSTQNILAEVM